jgi:hypothetical protein
LALAPETALNLLQIAYYFGPAKSSSSHDTAAAPTVTLDPCDGATATTTTSQTSSAAVVPCKMTSNGQKVLGGAVTVQNGTGAGQMRRIVAWPNVSHNPTITIDRPFDPPLDDTSFVTVSPYWGHMIWDNVNMSDGGHFQFYGAVFDTIVHGLSTYRLGGIMGSTTGGDYFGE